MNINQGIVNINCCQSDFDIAIVLLAAKHDHVVNLSRHKHNTSPCKFMSIGNLRHRHHHGERSSLRVLVLRNAAAFPLCMQSKNHHRQHVCAIRRSKPTHLTRRLIIFAQNDIIHYRIFESSTYITIKTTITK